MPLTRDTSADTLFPAEADSRTSLFLPAELTPTVRSLKGFKKATLTAMPLIPLYYILSDTVLSSGNIGGILCIGHGECVLHGKAVRAERKYRYAV